MKNQNKHLEYALNLVRSGLLSARDFAYKTGHKITIGGKVNYSKYTGGDIRNMNRKNGVGRPPGEGNPKIGKNMDEMYRKWHISKFGAEPQED